MYSKVALVSLIAFIISGCSTTKPVKPKEPIKEPIYENNLTISYEKPQIIVLGEEEVVKPKKKKNYNLKPEPFSLESNEDDPELLGPQSTLDNPLVREDENIEEEQPIENINIEESKI